MLCYSQELKFLIFLIMYKVVYSQELCEVTIYSSEDVLQACQFALSMHQASTESHELRVVHESDFVLLLKK